MGTLRLLLAIAVLLQHVRGCRYAMTGGSTSVETFFIISGFLIAMILDAKYNRPGQLWLFYSNRALRIYSTYWAVLAATVLLEAAAQLGVHQSVFELWRENAHRLGAMGPWYLGVTNVFILGQDLALFMALGSHGLHWSLRFWDSTPVVPAFMLIPPAWSLSLELCFYALAPWLLRRRTRWIVAAMLLSVAIRAALWFAGLREDPWSYRFFPSEVSLFLAGALSYRLIYRRLQQQGTSLKARLFAAGIVPAVALYPLYDNSHGMFFSTTKVLYLAYAVMAIPVLFRTTGGIQLDRWLGDLSYPLYLCHYSIVQVLNHFSSRVNVYLRISVAIAMSCGAAWLCVVLLERPLDRIRQARVKRASLRNTEGDQPASFVGEAAMGNSAIEPAQQS